MQVKKTLLILSAGLLWLIAGINVSTIGWREYSNTDTNIFLHIIYVALTALFFLFMFRRSYTRNVNRIIQLREIKHPLSFFDFKGWMLIVFMIALGVSVRSYGLLPSSFIAPFYQGLGGMLVLFGCRFLFKGIAYQYSRTV